MKLCKAIILQLINKKNFLMICSSSVENANHILIEIELNLYIVLGSMVILTILISLVHERVYISMYSIFLCLLIELIFFHNNVLYIHCKVDPQMH